MKTDCTKHAETWEKKTETNVFGYGSKHHVNCSISNLKPLVVGNL